MDLNERLFVNKVHCVFSEHAHGLASHHMAVLWCQLWPGATPQALQCHLLMPGQETASTMQPPGIARSHSAHRVDPHALLDVPFQVLGPGQLQALHMSVRELVLCEEKKDAQLKRHITHAQPTSSPACIKCMPVCEAIMC